MALALLLPDAAAAVTVSLPPLRDNTIYADGGGGDISNGAGQHFFAGTNGAGDPRRGLLAFDIAGAVPAGAQVDAARLMLNLTRVSDPADADVALHRLLADWGEASSDAAGAEGGGANALAGDATWLHTFSPTALWDDPGGDFVAAPSASLAVGDLGIYSWESPGMAADIQLWLDEPGAAFGWILVGDESINRTAKRFDSRDNPEPGFRPVLVVDYTPIPEPATSALLAALAAVFVLGAVRRRRRMPG